MTGSSIVPESSATLDDIASQAPVSPATASRVLHGSGGRRVGVELRERLGARAMQLALTDPDEEPRIERFRSRTCRTSVDGTTRRTLNSRAGCVLTPPAD